MTLTIYFHNDFDGIAAAALLTDIFRKKNKYEHFNYIPVDFDIKNEWQNMKLEYPSAVLDFFYHPDATYYYDHHDSPLSKQIKNADFTNDENMCLNTQFKSTPSILKYKFENTYNFTPYQELLKWSDIIDNAEYKSPHDLYHSNEIYILINKVISYFQYCRNNEELIKIIPYILEDPDAYINQKMNLLDNILVNENEISQKLKKEMIIDNNVCYIDQSRINFPVQRFVSYYYCPDLDYTIIIYQKNNEFMVNVGRNAWKEFDSKDLGEIVKEYGGFGRKNVGGILLSSHYEATITANKIIKDLLNSK